MIASSLNCALSLNLLNYGTLCKVAQLRIANNGKREKGKLILSLFFGFSLERKESKYITTSNYYSIHALL